MSFVQGYFLTLTVNGESFQDYTSSADLTLTNETLDKTTLGVSSRQYITGLQDGTISAQMHLDTAGVGLLQAAYSSTDPVTFVFRPGKLGGPDAGQWIGGMIITDLTITGSVDDNWQANFSAQISGDVIYTQPA